MFHFEFFFQIACSFFLSLISEYKQYETEIYIIFNIIVRYAAIDAGTNVK